MAAPRVRKRKSEEVTMSTDAYAPAKVAATTTPDEGLSEEGPRKKRKVGLTPAQKQALIDNLQLEITERARKLRAHYNIHAQSLRTRIEIRVNRIPTALRKVKMGDLLQKYSAEQQPRPGAALTTARLAPQVPEKDECRPRPGPYHAPAPGARVVSPTRPLRRPSDRAVVNDKENETEKKMDKLKKKPHGAAAVRGNNPAQVLSPTSSNSRVVPRDRTAASPSKSLIARPVSPVKPGLSTNILSSMVEKARSTRAGVTSRMTTASSSSSSGGTASQAAKTRRGATAKTSAASGAARRPASRATGRGSGASESSEGSTATVVKRKAGAAGTAPNRTAAPPAARRTAIGSIKKGVAGGATTKKAPATKTAPATAAAPGTGTGRVLRRRN